MEQFSKLVDKALEVMREMLKNNVAVQKHVAGGVDNAETT